MKEELEAKKELQPYKNLKKAEKEAEILINDMDLYDQLNDISIESKIKKRVDYLLLEENIESFRYLTEQYEIFNSFSYSRWFDTSKMLACHLDVIGDDVFGYIERYFFFQIFKW